MEAKAWEVQGVLMVVATTVHSVVAVSGLRTGGGLSWVLTQMREVAGCAPQCGVEVCWELR
jgi:hypothetical protein